MTLKDKRFIIALDYPLDKRARLKAFCSIINISVSRFTQTALENEMEARLEAMDKNKRDAVIQILGDTTKV